MKSPLFLKRAAQCWILKTDVASVWVVANKSITAPWLHRFCLPCANTQL